MSMSRPPFLPPIAALVAALIGALVSPPVGASAAVAELPGPDGLGQSPTPAPQMQALLSDRFAQYRPVSPRGRAVSDHDHARESTRAGENRGFDELMRSAQSRGRGEYLGVEPDIGRNIYRFKFLRSGGNVVWVDVDGRTGRVVAERD